MRSRDRESQKGTPSPLYRCQHDDEVDGNRRHTPPPGDPHQQGVADQDQRAAQCSVSRT